MTLVPPEAPAVLVEEARRILLTGMVAALPHGVWTEGEVLGSHPYRLIHRYGGCGDAELQGSEAHPHHPDAESFLPTPDHGGERTRVVLVVDRPVPAGPPQGVAASFDG